MFLKIEIKNTEEKISAFSFFVRRSQRFVEGVKAKSPEKEKKIDELSAGLFLRIVLLAYRINSRLAQNETP